MGGGRVSTRPGRRALPAGQLSHGGPPVSQRGPRHIEHNLIYYPRFSFRLGCANAIDSCLMNCIRGVDYLNGFVKKKKKLWRVFGGRTKMKENNRECSRPLQLNSHECTFRTFTQQLSLPSLVNVEYFYSEVVSGHTV